MRHAAIVWLAGLLLCPSVVSAQGGLINYPEILIDANHLTNPDLETGDLTGWTTTKWAIATDEAHGGTYSAKTTDCTGGLTHYEALEEGKVYQMSAWVKTENVADGSVRLLVNTKNSPYCELGCGSTLGVSGTQDWTYLLVTDIAVTGAAPGAYARVDCYSNPTGTAWVDDLTFHEQLPQDIEAKLIQPSYRGYLWSDMDQEAVFEIVNNDGGTVESVITYVADPGNPVTDTHGTNPGTVTLPLTGSATIAFRIQGEATPNYPQYKIVTQAASARQTWPISWTDDNRFRIDDVPTFLIGVYDSGLGFSSTVEGFDTIFDTYRRLDEIDSDLNVYLNYHYGEMTFDPYLEAMHENLVIRGMGYWQTANCFSSSLGAAGSFPALNDQTYAESLATEPNFYGVYIMDECINGLADDVFGKTVVAREWMPKGADLVVSNKATGLPLWYDVGDILAMDPYPYPQVGTGESPNQVAQWAAATKTAVSDSRPFLTVLGFFKFWGGRYPTAQELKDQSIMAITEGAQGLMYWSIGNGTGALAIQGCTNGTWCPEKEELYQRLKDVAAEINGYSSWLVAADDNTQLAAKSNSNINCLAKAGGYLLCYNDVATSEEVTFTWDETVSAVVALNEGDPSGDRSITPSSTQWSDTFTSYASHVYQITGGGAPPDPELDIVGKLRGHPSATAVSIVWGDDTLTSDDSCTATLKDSGGGTLDSTSHPEGFSTRTTQFSGLDPATSYSVVIACSGYEDATYAFATLAATSGTGTYTISFHPADVNPSAEKVKVYYAIPGQAASSVTDDSCSLGCDVDLTLTRRVLYEVRYEWLDSGDAVVADFAVPFNVQID